MNNQSSSKTIIWLACSEQRQQPDKNDYPLTPIPAPFQKGACRNTLGMSQSKHTQRNKRKKESFGSGAAGMRRRPEASAQREIHFDLNRK